ncbi:UDP-N-acetylmuramoyl-tripeptide--D-alanyl-D-alanine ligase [Nocardioides malaquae]|nr:UDP-N-acetylmuramoyl-tripeptide--D-alanyl-D-alanine ligase [Nocardioides malaquae]
MRLSEVAAVVGGTLDRGAGESGPDPEPGSADPGDIVVSGAASVDSRQVPAGGLFVAIEGEHVDGHDYARAALEAGAVAVLASRPCGVPAVLVPDPVAALGLLARHVVDHLPATTVLALTGSQGKTGTKDYLAALLAPEGGTVATAGNFNNELGVPLTVLRADESTRFLVVEMGARGVGHIAHLCSVAPPRVAAVLNVGTAHVGEFGGRDRIAVAKGEIVEALPADGTAVLNAGDEYTATMGERTDAHVLTFGADGDVAWRGLRLDASGRPTFELGHRGRWVPVQLTQLGLHQVENAAAAAAMALAVGVGLDDVATRLGEVREMSRWRMEPHVRADGLLVVNDAYNANPESMSAAVHTLAHLGAARPGRSVAVLGEMRELGDADDEGHRSVGAAVAEAGVDVLVTVGGAAAAIAAGARSAGWQGEAIVTAGRDEALVWVRENVTSGDVVLVKASRGAALELIVEGILEGAAAR